jgi:hypothetical protein
MATTFPEESISVDRAVHAEQELKRTNFGAE